MESVNFRSERDLKVAQLNPLPLREAQSWERDMARSRAGGTGKVTRQTWTWAEGPALGSMEVTVSS